jgi:signal transduction histidine kinase
MLVLLQLFALFLLVLLGFYVFVANPRSRANQTFAAFIAFLALWTTKDIILWNFHESDESASWWGAASFITALLMQCSLVIFAWVFPENLRTPRKRAAVVFAPALVLIPAALSGLLWTFIGFRGDLFKVELAPLSYLFVLYVYSLFSFGAYILFRKYRQHHGTQAGQQLGAILTALGITVSSMTFANIILPFWGNYQLLPYSAIFVLPGVLIYAYAISNFKLFSLENAFDQFRLFPITYKVALSIASVAILSFSLFQIPIVYYAFSSDLSSLAWKKYLVLSVISALVPNLILVLLVVRSITRPLQRITLAAVRVTNGLYGTEVEGRQTNDEIGLLASSFNEMSRKMKSDIDQLRALNEQMMRTEKLAAMGTLAAGVAHEVNNPLASISSLIQMMQSKEADPEKLEQLELIETQIRRISRVTNDMMDFARVRPAARTMISINDIVESSIRLATFDKSFQRLGVVKVYGENLPLISADRDQLQQVFLNLLLNARDAMPDGGQVTVTTILSNNFVTITVSDSGSGISKERRDQIFDPFFTTKSAKGTGLGLAVCYGIVTAHDGTIEVSENIGGGSSFNVAFPIGES